MNSDSSSPADGTSLGASWQPSVERSPADWRRLTGLWRFGVTVLPPACTDFYAWLDVLDAAIDERTNRMPQPPSDDMNKHLTRDNG